MLQSRRQGEFTHYIDAYNERTSNWLRWVNCARHVKEQNVDLVRCRGKEFYLTVKDVHPGQELLIYYGDNYARNELDIDVSNYYNMDVDIKLYEKYACWNIQNTK
jgi:hypothetical protein